MLRELTFLRRIDAKHHAAAVVRTRSDANADAAVAADRVNVGLAAAVSLTASPVDCVMVRWHRSIVAHRHLPDCARQPMSVATLLVWLTVGVIAVHCHLAAHEVPHAILDSASPVHPTSDAIQTSAPHVLLAVPKCDVASIDPMIAYSFATHRSCVVILHSPVRFAVVLCEQSIAALQSPNAILCFLVELIVVSSLIVVIVIAAMQYNIVVIHVSNHLAMLLMQTQLKTIADVECAVALVPPIVVHPV